MVGTLVVVISVVGSIASIYSVYHLITVRRLRSWRSVARGTREIRRKIRERSIEPDLIVTLGVGGSVVGGLLASSLGRTRIIGIDRRYEWTNGSRTTVVDAPSSIDLPDPPRTVLLVTGEIYDGVSLRLAAEFVKNMLKCDLLTAAMYVWENSDFFPDFYAYRIEKRVRPPWRLEGSVRDSKADRVEVADS